MDHAPTREDAWKILTDHVRSPNLISHARAVEAAMRHLARKKGADEEMWGVVGLIHDVDYEEHPDEHLRHAPEMLRGRGWHEGHARGVAAARGGPGGAVGERSRPACKKRPQEVEGQGVRRRCGPLRDRKRRRPHGSAH